MTPSAPVTYAAKTVWNHSPHYPVIGKERGNRGEISGMLPPYPMEAGEPAQRGIPTVLDVLQFEFMRNAIYAGLLASVVCGVIGTYVVVKRIVFISGGISHASFGGLGLATWLAIPQLYGALAFSLLAAVLIGLVNRYGREREDTLIGALWATGMAMGILFIDMTPGYAVDPTSILFGDILRVSSADVWLVLALNIVVVATVVFFYKEFLAVSLDQEFAQLRGVPVGVIYLLLLCLVALTIVIMLRVVGIVLVVALLTLPAAISRWYTSQLHTMMILSSVLGGVFIMSGLAISYLTDRPAGACIILTAAAVYAVVWALRRVSWAPAA